MADIEGLRKKHLQEIDAKLEELRPAYDEYTELQAYKESLAGVQPRARRSTRTSGPGSRAGVDRKQDFIDALREIPGSDIPEIAKYIQTKNPEDSRISSNYLYRVRDGLVDDGIVRREGPQGRQHYLNEESEEPTQEEAPKRGRGKKAPEPAAA